jgi:hypothetical protein
MTPSQPAAALATLHNTQRKRQSRQKKSIQNAFKTNMTLKHQQIMAEWARLGLTTTHDRGKRALKKIFNYPKPSLQSTVRIEGGMFRNKRGGPRVKLKIDMLAGETIRRKKKTHPDALRFINSTTNRMDPNYTLENWERDFSITSSSDRYTALGFKATSDGMLSWNPVLPKFLDPRTLSELSAESREVWESVSSMSKAITDFHVDSFFWGTFIHCLYGTKIIICCPCTDGNWEYFKPYYGKTGGCEW